MIDSFSTNWTASKKVNKHPYKSAFMYECQVVLICLSNILQRNYLTIIICRLKKNLQYQLLFSKFVNEKL